MRLQARVRALEAEVTADAASCDHVILYGGSRGEQEQALAEYEARHGKVEDLERVFWVHLVGVKPNGEEE